VIGAMLGQFGGASLSNGQPDPGAFESVAFPGDGAFDRIAELARFLLQGDAGIVDLGNLLVDASGLGISTAPDDASGLARIADPVAALKLGFASQVSVPIRAGRERIGTLAVVSRGQQAFDAVDVETLHRLAGMVAEGVSLRMGRTIR
jgi:GAF domain-containing protein